MITKLIITPLEDDVWELVEDFIIYSNIANKLLKVPKGFPTDCGSVPSIIQPVISATGNMTEAYVLHDYLYSQKAFTRKVCDYIFYEILLRPEYKVKKWKAKCIFYAVRWFGGFKRGTW